MIKFWRTSSVTFLYLLLIACSAAQFLKPDKPTEKPYPTRVDDVGNQKFSTNEVSFEYPGSWRTVEEIFGMPSGKTREPEFDAEVLITVTNAIASPFGEKYTAWCSLMTRLPNKSHDLHSLVYASYKILENYPDSEISIKDSFIDGYRAVEKVYKRPRGEPWYQVRDVWIEVDNSVLILSCYSNPSEFEKNSEIFRAILNSLTLNLARKN